MSQPLTIVHAGRETAVPRKLPQGGGAVAQVGGDYQPHDADLDTIAAQSNSTFGLHLLTVPNLSTELPPIIDGGAF